MENGPNNYIQKETPTSKGVEIALHESEIMAHAEEKGIVAESDLLKDDLRTHEMIKKPLFEDGPEEVTGIMEKATERFDVLAEQLNYHKETLSALKKDIDLAVKRKELLANKKIREQRLVDDGYDQEVVSLNATNLQMKRLSRSMAQLTAAYDGLANQVEIMQDNVDNAKPSAIFSDLRFKGDTTDRSTDDDVSERFSAN